MDRARSDGMEMTINSGQFTAKQEKESLLRVLDRGIDDMEAGRELPLEEALKVISELRNNRRNARV